MSARKIIDLAVFQGEARRVRVVIKTPVLGELTTRTNSTTCVLTYETGSITPVVGESYELRWGGGRRSRMLATSATGQAVTFSGGTGSPLPATGTSVAITGFTQPRDIAGWDAECIVRTKTGTVVGTFRVGATEDADGGPIAITDSSGIIDFVFNETWTAAADPGYLRYDPLITPDDRRPFVPFGGNISLQARGSSSPAFDSDTEVTVNLDQDVIIEIAEGLPGEDGTGGGGGGGGDTSFSDTDFEVYDNVTPTKKFKLQVSGVTGGTTRTITVPDANGTMALTSDITTAVAAEAALARNADNLTSGTVADARIASTIARDSEVTAAIAALSSVYQPLDGDLSAISLLSGTNTIYYRSGSDTWTAVTIGSSLSFSGGTLNLGTTPALGTPASGDFSTGSFTWPTFNQNTTGTAAIATTITAANEATDTTCFPVFVAAATGNLGPKTNTSFTFNSSTGAVGFTSAVLGGTISASGWSITKGGAATLDSCTITGSSAITLGLYTVTAAGSATISGTNTGDQTSVTGNAGTATALQNARTIGGSSFDGTANVTSFPSPGAIGGTTPAAGTFTTLVAGSTTSLLLGTAGSAVGNIGFRNATSGTATLAPPTGALGTYTVTLPNAASTLPIYTQQITYSGPTAARTITLPDANFTVARTDAANTFTGTQTITQIDVGNTDTSITRAGAGDIAIEGNTVYRAGGTDVAVADGGTGLSSGTSGGVLYYSGSTTIASSAALAANALVIGGGAGAAPSTTTTGTGNLTALAANANATGGFVTTDGTATLTNKIISLAALPGTDDTYQGFAITGRNAGTTIAQWEAVYLNSSGEWVLADANGSSTYPAQGLAVAAYSSGNAATVLVIGTVRNDSWNWTVGGRIYLSATAGALTQTQPSTSGDKVQYIGFAPTADSIFVNPSSTFLEVA